MADEVNPKLAALIERLTRATERGVVAWQLQSETSFSYSTGSSSVIIASLDHDGQYPFVLRVLDNSGTELESELSHRGSLNYQERPLATEIERLYELARRSALNVDPVLDDLLNSVDRALGHDEDERF